jgi:hypothetical protein
MKIEIPQSSEIPDHPLTSPAYHSQEYVEGFPNMYHSGHPANAASAHHGGYHSDSEQHHSNGLNHPNGRTRDGSVQDSHHNSPQLNGGDKMSGSGDHGSKSPPTNGGSNTTTPTTELGKTLSMNMKL